MINPVWACVSRQNVFTLSTIGGFRSRVYCCVPTTSSLPCCHASSLVTLPSSKGLHSHLQPRLVQAHGQEQETLHDELWHYMQIIFRSVTFLELGQHKGPQRCLVEQGRLIDCCVFYFSCLQEMKHLSNRTILQMTKQQAS